MVLTDKLTDVQDCAVRIGGVIEGRDRQVLTIIGCDLFAAYFFGRRDLRVSNQMEV
ncbi:hypothetical protein [Rubinisphaera sp.]|uniref:hypothetical protein n=1 Tax=Rubinisphaera sp. TaxID=2024857 RepID=UPI0025FB9F75|nr:hypothetical protein [Rubinisphaera sp.]|tara:strand:- start:8490 stop:8657 length:168 start_codon:yes stop_codon:yes gene_type:complete